MSDEKKTWTQDELVAEAQRRFPGKAPRLWRFVCPNCGDEASAQDFANAGAKPELVGQECIGREHAERGCDWVAYGLIRGPWFIEVADEESTRQVPSFALAAGDQEVKA